MEKNIYKKNSHFNLWKYKHHFSTLILLFFVFASLKFHFLEDKSNSSKTLNLLSPVINNVEVKNEKPRNNRKERIYTIITTGDVIPARMVNYRNNQLNDYTYPFKNTAKLLKSADIVFVNLEAPLIENCPVTMTGMVFCGNTKNIEGLVFSSVDVVNVANNHFGNYGLEGIDQTIKLLNRNNIKTTGSDAPAILKIEDKKFGFLGYNLIEHKQNGISWADPEKIRKEVGALKKQVDLIIVAFHWGDEYNLVPNEKQIELAHLTIDAGADLIIGNHPHWVQGNEIYKGKFISYAQGNFVFDQMWSLETRQGIIQKFTFNDEELKSVQYFPVIIEDYSQPRLADKAEGETILNRMRESSGKIKLMSR